MTLKFEPSASHTIFKLALVPRVEMDLRVCI